MASQYFNIQYLKGVGEKRAELLNKLGISSLDALLRYFPRKYQDWSNPISISDAVYGENFCVKGKIVTPINENKKRNNMVIYSFNILDENSDTMRITIFNNKYLAKKLHTGSTYLFYGKLNYNSIFKEMVSPEIENEGANVIKPIYPAINGLSSKIIEKIIQNAITAKGIIKDPLPEFIRKELNLCDIVYAIQNIHHPKTKDALKAARKRFIFEELYLMQMGMLFFKNKKKEGVSVKVNKDYVNEFFPLLPYSLTNAQKTAIFECLTDMEKATPMNRLIQGDVGSGKTAIALALCFVCAKNGLQSALMVPTEVLAEQHFKNFENTLSAAGISCVLLTGSMTPRQKQKVYEQIENGTADIVIGTHAVLSPNVNFKNLGLVIADEQHRFGVAQRYMLNSKGNFPHSLIMSATPIPRTLSLIIYGDLDISIVNEYPKGRQKIETYFVSSDYHERVYNYIKKHLDEGRQGYIICPLVEENESLDIFSAEQVYEKLKDTTFKDYSVGLLHGKMSAKQKNDVMHRFDSGEIQLLISTTVIEVGVDVPNSAIMVIENAERFGISQLHQLRGRIGRGQYKSTCILISDTSADTSVRRLKTLCANSDGFKIADEDLKMRGPGDFIGQRQHGLPTLRIADMETDIEVLKTAGIYAKKTISLDPRLQKPEHSELKNQVMTLYQNVSEN